MVESDVSEEDENILMVVASGVLGDEWVLDSGASYHITSNINCFSSYVNKEGNAIVMENVLFIYQWMLVSCEFECSMV